MFTPEERRRICGELVVWAEADERVEQAALVGSLAVDEGDAWSDVDLALGVAGGTSIEHLVEDWTRKAADSFGAVPLIDLSADGTLYRVLLLPGCLQVDLSFTPADAFRKASPRFKPLFGGFQAWTPSQPSVVEPFGWALLYLLAGRTYIERGRWWQALHYVDAARDHVLKAECARRGLPTNFARGVDDLPSAVLEPFRGTLVGSLDRNELVAALVRTAKALQLAAPHLGGLSTAHTQRLDEFVHQLETAWS